MITSRTRMRTKIKKKSKKDNKELRETGASFSVGYLQYKGTWVPCIGRKTQLMVGGTDTKQR